MDVGFVGLGQMGAAIATNLLAAGHAVSVWNRSADKLAPLVTAGARAADSPADAARGGVVISMLADDRAVEAVTFGDDGLLSAETPALHVSMSTISPALAARLAEAHGPECYVSAPVFGRPDAAASGQLFVVAAGHPAALARARPLLEVVSQRVFDLGAHAPAANIVKLAGNFLLMATIQSLAEALTFGEKNGVPKAALLEVLTGTLFGTRPYRLYGQMIVEDRYRPAGFAAPLGLKDMNLVAEAALGQGVPMPVLSLVRDRLLATIAREGGDIDWSGIAKLVGDDAGR